MSNVHNVTEKISENTTVLSRKFQVQNYVVHREVT